MTGPWIDTLELYQCRVCGALVATIDQPGGSDKDGLTLHNKSHGVPSPRSNIEVKAFRFLGDFQVEVRDLPVVKQDSAA